MSLRSAFTIFAPSEKSDMLRKLLYVLLSVALLSVGWLGGSGFALLVALVPMLLIGLLGTVVGMIEAFGLVALYGDEGGASILSDSISKALITTAAGLIIAAPAIALYFIIKNRIMKLASLVEVEVENVITTLYLEGDSTDMNTPGSKEEKHETKL